MSGFNKRALQKPCDPPLPLVSQMSNADDFHCATWTAFTGRVNLHSTNCAEFVAARHKEALLFAVSTKTAFFILHSKADLKYTKVVKRQYSKPVSHGHKVSQ